MCIADMACFTAVGEVPEELEEEFVNLEESFYQSMSDLADGFFTDVTANIIEAFRIGSANPLCVVFVCCLLVVLAFHLIPSIFNVFRGRG